ncbi:MAG: histidine kinase dimerization/phospho-acceptor domain-containing protein, partial [Bacteroidota bacterium]
MQDRRLRLLTYFIMGYMLLAFVWWSVLLIAKNKDAFLAKSELLQIGLAAEGLIKSPEEYFRSDRYEILFKDYKRQENMIMGEALFLSISLLIGIYLVYRGYRREVAVSQQQSNFLLSITHELKSPLAGIRLALETILKRSDRLKPKQIEGLSVRG